MGKPDQLQIGQKISGESGKRGGKKVVSAEWKKVSGAPEFETEEQGERGPS